jgi:hypothetical protein
LFFIIFEQIQLTDEGVFLAKTTTPANGAIAPECALVAPNVQVCEMACALIAHCDDDRSVLNSYKLLMHYDMLEL